MTEHGLKGVDFDADALVLELIHRAGPGGAYISQRHTLNRLRKEHYMPRLSDRKYYSAWTRGGSKQIRDEAGNKARKIPETHSPQPLDHDVDKEVSSISMEAASRANRS